MESSIWENTHVLSVRLLQWWQPSCNPLHESHPFPTTWTISTFSILAGCLLLPASSEQPAHHPDTWQRKLRQTFKSDSLLEKGRGNQLEGRHGASPPPLPALGGSGHVVILAPRDEAPTLPRWVAFSKNKMLTQHQFVCQQHPALLRLKQLLLRSRHEAGCEHTATWAFSEVAQEMKLQFFPLKKPSKALQQAEQRTDSIEHFLLLHINVSLCTVKRNKTADQHSSGLLLLKLRRKGTAGKGGEEEKRMVTSLVRIHFWVVAFVQSQAAVCDIMWAVLSAPPVQQTQWDLIQGVTYGTVMGFWKQKSAEIKLKRGWTSPPRPSSIQNALHCFPNSFSCLSAWIFSLSFVTQLLYDTTIPITPALLGKFFPKTSMVNSLTFTFLSEQHFKPCSPHNSVPLFRKFSCNIFFLYLTVKTTWHTAWNTPCNINLSCAMSYFGFLQIAVLLKLAKFPVFVWDLLHFTVDVALKNDAAWNNHNTTFSLCCKKNRTNTRQSWFNRKQNVNSVSLSYAQSPTCSLYLILIRKPCVSWLSTFKLSFVAFLFRAGTYDQPSFAELPN